MKPKSGGNGSGKIDIGIQDMGGWVQVRLSRSYDLPSDIHVGMSSALTQWFRERPNLQMRIVVPIQKDGETVELHAWYDTVVEG